ncbi:hypothetical protein QE152_g41012, partial [Popillia japonica]
MKTSGMGDQPDSDDYSTDEYKRKRGEEGAFFKKSAKIPRTPSKSKDKAEEKTRADEKMDRMLEMMENMTKEVALIRTEQREFNEEFEHGNAANSTNATNIPSFFSLCLFGSAVARSAQI